MDAERYRRLQALFLAAKDLAGVERTQFISRACQNDESLRGDLGRLLAEHDQASRFLERPVLDPMFAARAMGVTADLADASTLQIGALAECAGTVIGRYKLLEQIGEGGFGSVFVAEQREPVVRRVALKIIKLGMDTRQIIARFEQERQALALMDHPHIAKVFDAGATETGRPYFVMELCTGTAITQYCDWEHLTIRERLQLFAQVCHAVQHAHQKGIIHRDIKPSNVLVHTQDGRPFAKVIDFGIAKATAARLTELTLFTEHGQFMGTPAYMSPEQAQGSLDIDTRTDVYSLGILLYELLTGTTPFDAESLRAAAYNEIVRMIRDIEPPKPSTRLSGFTGTLPSIAAARRTEPKQLNTLLRGDLDWIVMKALEKDRARRYESADGLAADLARHLAGDPIVARRPSAWGHLRRFARRNRGLAASVVATFVALLVSTISLGVSYLRVDRKRRQKNQALDDYRAVGRLMEGFIRTPDATRLGRDARVLDSLVLAAGTLDEAMRARPMVEAEFRRFIGVALAEYGRAEEALNGLDRAERLLGSDPSIPASMATRLQLGRAIALTRLDRFAEATPILGQVLDIAPVSAEECDELLLSIATAVSMLLDTERTPLEQLDEGERFLRRALDLGRRLRGAESTAFLRGLNVLTDAVHAQAFREGSAEKLTQAKIIAEEAAAISRTLPHDTALDIHSQATLAFIRFEISQRDESVIELERIVQAARERLGASHFELVPLLKQLAEMQQHIGRHEQATQSRREAYEICLRSLGRDDFRTAQAAESLARMIGPGLNNPEAIGFLRLAIEIHERELGREHSNTLELWAAYLGMLYAQQDSFPDALLEARNALAKCRNSYRSTDPQTLEAMKIVRMILAKGEQTEELVRLCQEEIAARKEVDPEDGFIIQATHNLLNALVERGAPEEALRVAADALQSLHEQNPADYSRTVPILLMRAAALRKMGRFAEGETTLLDAKQRLASANPGADLGNLPVAIEGNLFRLYEAWDRAHPGEGLDAKASLHLAERTRLEAASRRPVSPSRPERQ